jgi:HK97 gp10 family phage protein
MSRARVTLETKILDSIIAECDKEAAAIVKAGAFAVEGQAKTKAPVDTGALKSSLEAEENGSPLRWWVHDGVEYGIYQELGTSKMSAQPFLVPAVEAVRDNWVALWRKFFERWK